MLRKFKLGGVILAALLALVGCQSDRIIEQSSSDASKCRVTLTASKGVGSRTAIIDGKTVWTEGDAIFVSSKDGKVTGRLELELSSIQDGDATSGTFTGWLTGGSKESLAYSVYPAPEKGETIIDLSQLEGAGFLNAPMAGKIDNEAEVNVMFNHASGLLYVNMPRAIDLDLKVSAVDDQSNTLQLGAMTDVTDVDFDSNGNPKLKFTSKQSHITVKNTKGGEMYIPYYVTNASEVNMNKVTFKEDNFNLILNENVDLIDAENKKDFIGRLVKTGYQTNNYDPEKSAFIGDVPELETSIATSPENKVKASVSSESFETLDSDNAATEHFNVSASYMDADNQLIPVDVVEVTLPKVATDNKSVEISFSDVSNDVALIIQEEEGVESEKSIKELVLILPSEISEDEVKEKMIVNMPNTTVTIQSADKKTVKIKHLEAATSAHTLKIDFGVFVDTLVVHAGNVEIYGETKYCKRGEKNEAYVYIYTPKKGELIIEFGDPWIFIVKEPFVPDDEMIIIENREFSSALKDLLKIELNENGYAVLSKSLVESVKELNFGIDKYKIPSLDGIEYFVNLEKLSGNTMGLESCDLTKNTALTYIYLPNNHLTNIDLTKNTALSTLILAYNPLSSIDVSKNIELWDLNVNGYYLENIDLSKNTKLRALQIFGNKLTELDLSHNTELMNLTCSSNQLNTLDVSMLPDLDELVCNEQQDNRILKLKIAESQRVMWNNKWKEENGKTVELYPSETDEPDDEPEDNPVVPTITIQNVELSLALKGVLGEEMVTLDSETGYAIMKESDILQVTQLDFTDKGYTIPSLDGIKLFANLTELNCSGTELSFCDLSQNKALTKVDVSDNKLKELNMSNNTALTELFCGCQKDADGKDVTLILNLGENEVLLTMWKTWETNEKNKNVKLYGSTDDENNGSNIEDFEITNGSWK